MVHLNMINSDHNDRVNHIKLPLSKVDAKTANGPFSHSKRMLPFSSGKRLAPGGKVLAPISGGWLITTSNLSGFGGEDEAFFDTTEEASHFIKIFVDKMGSMKLAR